MAGGHSVGTIFAELDLDASRYMKGQQQLYKDATQTALGIEENFKKLGVRSSAEFDLMRQKAINAFQGIVHSSKATADDIVRAEQAKNETLKRLNEQQYGHHASFTERLKKNWLAASAAIAAASIAMYKAWDLADRAAKFEQEKIAFANLAASYGANADNIIADLKRLSGETVSQAVLIEKAGTAIMMGINPEKVSRLMEIARATSKMTGQSVTEAFDNISLAVGRQSKMILDNLGIIVSVENANKSYAAELGKTSEALTDAEKKMAFLNATVAAGEDLMQRLGNQTDTTRDKMDRLKAQSEDLKIVLGQGLIRAGSGLFATFQSVAAAALGLSGGLFKVMQGYSSLVSHLPGTDKAKWEDAAKEWGDNAKAAFEASEDLLFKANDNFAIAMKTSTAHATAYRTINSEIESGINATGKAAVKNSKEDQENLRAELGLLLNVEDAYYATEQAIQAMADAGDEAAEAVKKLLSEDYLKIMAGVNTDSQSYYQNRIDAIIAEEQKRFDAIDLMRITDQENEKQYLADKAKAHEVAEEKIAKLEYERFTERTNMIADSFGQLQSAFSAIAKSYDEGSSASKRWEEAAKTMEVAQRAVAVVQAVAAIATQGLGDPYTAFARIAAMAATMGALLASIGESVNSGGGSSSSHKSTSTALGSEEASQSVSKSYELLKDTYDMQNTRLTALYNQMKDLNSNITGLVSSIFRTGGLSASGMSLSGDFTKSLQQTVMNSYINQKSGLLTDIGNFLNKPVYDVGGWLAGKGTSKKVKEAGFALGEYSYGDDLSVQNWQKIKYEKDGGAFHSDKTWYKEKTTELTAEQAEIGRLFNTMYSNLSGSLVELSKGLGTDIEDALEYSFKAATLNLKDMTDEEMTAEINRYFSEMSDNAAEALFGDVVSKYQKVNEGLLETAVRLVQDKEIVLDYMEKVNKAFVGSTENAIAFSEALISAAGDLDALTSAIDTYYDKFFSDAEKQTNTVKQLTESLAAYGYSLPATREAFRAIVESIDAVADPQKYYDIIKLAGDMDEMFSYMEEAAEAAKEAAEAAAEAAKEAAEAALEAAKDSRRAEIEAQRTAYQERYNEQLKALNAELSKMQGYVSMLKSARESMKLDDILLNNIRFEGAQGRLKSLVGEVRGGNYSGLDNAQDMLNTLTAVNPAQFSTRQEYLKAYGTIYNQIAEMEKITGGKVDAQERQIEILEKTYALQQEYYDAQLSAIDTMTATTQNLGNVVWAACGYLAKYQSGEISLAQLTAVSSPDYATAKSLPKYADGGFASGWGIAGENGQAELINFGSGSRVYSNSDSKSLINLNPLLEEIKELRGEIAALAKYNKTTADRIDKWDKIGIPETQT